MEEEWPSFPSFTLSLERFDLALLEAQPGALRNSTSRLWIHGTDPIESICISRKLEVLVASRFMQQTFFLECGAIMNQITESPGECRSAVKLSIKTAAVVELVQPCHFALHNLCTYSTEIKTRRRVLISILREKNINFILGKITPIEWICEVNQERESGGS